MLPGIGKTVPTLRPAPDRHFRTGSVAARGSVRFASTAGRAVSRRLQVRLGASGQYHRMRDICSG